MITILLQEANILLQQILLQRLLRYDYDTMSFASMLIVFSSISLCMITTNIMITNNTTSMNRFMSMCISISIISMIISIIIIVYMRRGPDSSHSLIQ